MALSSLYELLCLQMSYALLQQDLRRTSISFACFIRKMRGTHYLCVFRRASADHCLLMQQSGCLHKQTPAATPPDNSKMLEITKQVT